MDRELIELVKKESELLRNKITKEEVEKLDLCKLDPSSVFHCIYGQLTGDCTSKRAEQLIKLCCEKVYHNKESHILKREYNIIDSPKVKYCNSPRRLMNYMSPIEIFINYCGTTNQLILLTYLRKETETLEFENY